MSEITEGTSTNNQRTTNYDTTKIFIGCNRYIDNQPYTNSGYDDVLLKAGTVMGRIADSQEVVPLDSEAIDGSQYPVGVLGHDYDVAEGDQADVMICVGGDIAEEKVILLNEDDTLSTVVDGRSIRDRISGDTLGIKLVPCTNLTEFDND